MSRQAVTVHELKQLLLEAVRLSQPQQFSAGELTEMLCDAGNDVTRPRVKAALETLRLAGECRGVKATFYRAGANRPGIAYTANRTLEQKRESARTDDPFRGLF